MLPLSQPEIEIIQSVHPVLEQIQEIAEYSNYKFVPVGSWQRVRDIADFRADLLDKYLALSNVSNFEDKKRFLAFIEPSRWGDKPKSTLSASGCFQSALVAFSIIGIFVALVNFSDTSLVFLALLSSFWFIYIQNNNKQAKLKLRQIYVLSFRLFLELDELLPDYIKDIKNESG